MQCEMCGKESTLVKALIEGTELNVCSECAKFGKILRQAPKPTEQQPKKAVLPSMPKSLSQQVQIIVENFGQLVKSRREQLGLKQEELAKRIAEKESLIQKIESGHFTPSISLARKLERFLKIKLVLQYEEKKISAGAGESKGLTVGDIIKD